MLKNLQTLPLDPIFQLLDDYERDLNPLKVNLGIGLYANEMGENIVFESVKKAFHQVDDSNFVYQPIGGNRDYLNLVTKLVLGDETDLEGIAMLATCGGTQACRIFGDLLARDEIDREIYIPTPTWGNHFAVFSGLKSKTFPHLAGADSVNFEGYKQALSEAKFGSVLMLHGGLTHNPTGLNLSYNQLQELIPIMLEKQIVVFIDAAYLGFGEGFERDAAYVRLLFDNLPNVATGISFSKNASLYEHRTGVLLIRTDRKATFETQMQQLLRESISMAPGLGQEIMANILANQKLNWLDEVEKARISLESRKNLLLSSLPENFKYLTECRGMFGFLPLTEAQILQLRSDFAIYMPTSGRVNFGGIKIQDIDYLASSIKTSLRKF